MNKQPNIEQLRQELLTQDPSLVGQKEIYIGLISRMVSHTPEVQIDQHFQKSLKSRLEYHLEHTIGNKIPTPAKRLNRLARLISYGLPTIAIGVIIFLALPGSPTSVMAPLYTGMQNIINSGEAILSPDNSNDNSSSITNTTSPIDPESINDSSSHEIVRMMMIENTNETSSITTSSNNTSSDQIASPKQSNTMQPRGSQNLNNNGFIINYTLTQSADEILLQGTISDNNCKAIWKFSKTLVGVDNNMTVIVSAIEESTRTSQNFTFSFSDNSIITIKGEHICPAQDNTIETKSTPDTKTVEPVKQVETR